MILSWLLGLLWPRKLIILTATLASLLGGVFVLMIAPPRYLATARVTMDYIKPDPFTGRYMASKSVEAYVISQVRMVTDYQVTVPALEAMGVLDSPDVAGAYASRPPSEQQIEFPQWAANRMMGGAAARIVPDSNILQIEFRGPEPTLALSTVEVLRQAYVEANINIRRGSAAGKADALKARVVELRGLIAKVEAEKTAYEHANGVSLSAASNDPDALALRRLVTAVDSVAAPRPAVVSETASRLQDLDSRIAAASANLGPNNPQLAALRRQREAVRIQLAGEVAAAGSTGSAMTARAAARDRLLEDQKGKVLANREKMLKLRLFQDEIDRHAAEIEKAMDDIGDLRQMATANVATVTSVGEPKLEPKPVFPNPPLVIAGSGGLGFVGGVLIALLTELLSRRIRSVRDLQLAAPAPILGVVPRAAKVKTKAARAPRERIVKRGRKAAQKAAA
jgi:succinoglycan biosynthesis transport protein ExoP